ncbi:hypothetical protein [Flavihumibacter fluvii]|uniref:hypothetical protein n=1 Tax=Flavihumibacter fluvii TaxID=2838157 RepID=UPI001BDE0BFF|nr:hypothetical protein [Flavihumibacter fluvii]ULQ54435.1 hypothetical protein KJS93_08905 [Flavihumibacter fluvii]
MANQIFSSKDFKRFIFSLLIFLFTLVASDLIIGKLLQVFYFRQKSGPDYEMTYAIDKSKEDFMVFGSSRARHHYYPPAFEKELSLSGYNAGRNGNFILYSNAVLQSVLHRHPPKIVLLDIVKHEFEEFAPNYDHLSVLLPFYNFHPELRPTIMKRGPYERIKLISSIYPFNSSLISIAQGNFESNKNREEIIKGYSPLSRTMTVESKQENNIAVYKIDTALVNAYENFIVSCKEKQVKLFVVCSPYYDTMMNRDTSLIIARELAVKHGIPFFDFTNDPEYTGKANAFYDKDHLNHEAAIKYSEKIAVEIRKELQQVAAN